MIDRHTEPHNGCGQSLLADVATHRVITLAEQDSVSEAACIMAESQISSIVVTGEDNLPTGIVTERNILYAMQTGCPRDTCLREIMSAPVITVPHTITVTDAYRVCLDRGIRHLVIVDDRALPISVANESDFRLCLNITALTGRRTIASVTGRSAAVLPPTAALDQALNLMLIQHESCVIAAEEERAVGIVTERDVVRFYARSADRAGVTVGEVMTSPVRTIRSDATVNQAAEAMLAHKVRNLVVEESGGRVYGSVNERDLIQAMIAGLADEREGMEESFLRTLIDTLPDLVWLKDINGVYLACNARFEQFYGAKESEIIGKTDYDFTNRELADFFREHDRKAMAANGPSTNEEWITFASDGHKELLETIKTPMRDRDGKLIGVLGIGRDITDRRAAEDALRVTASVFDTSQEAILITDAENLIVDVNPAFTRITGYRRDEVLGKDPRLLGSGRHDRRFFEDMWRSIERDKVWRGEIWNRDKSGEIHAVLLSITAICDAREMVQRYVAVFSDITHIKVHEAKLSRVAHYDSLTGVPNRVLLADRIKLAIAQTAREREMMAVCYLDLDGFKQINDTLGHEAGDSVLVEVARRIETTIRGGDTVARVGGDEFVVLLSNLKKDKEWMVILERLLEAIAEPIVVNDGSRELSASIGVSIYPQDNESPFMLLRYADRAMYQAKQSGKNRYHTYDPALD